MGQPSHPSGGVKVFSIGGRMVNVRERCLGMTDEERRWRAQYLKDQVLSDNEPRDVPLLYKNTTNIFRRLYKTPLWKFQTMLESMLGKEGAYRVRHFTTKMAASVAVLYFLMYNFKYNANDWCRSGASFIYIPRVRMFPDEPGYPNFHVKTAQEYYDLGFSSSVLCNNNSNEAKK